MAENRPDTTGEHGAAPPAETPEIRHEVRDVNEWAIGRFAIALMLICIASMALLFGLFHFFLDQNGGRMPTRARGLDIDARDLPPEPRLQVSPILDLQQMRAAEDRILNSYGWVDRSAGTVRIPIDRAMDILAQRGLPARQTTAPQSAAANVTVPTESGLGPIMQPPGGPLSVELYGPGADRVSVGVPPSSTPVNTPPSGGINTEGYVSTQRK